MIERPDRLTVPTCVGCAAMSRFGMCDAGCSEHRLGLVRAAAYDALLAQAVCVTARMTAFESVMEAIAQHEPVAGGFERAYLWAQSAARDALRRYPLDHPIIDIEQPAEHATTWWCAECGGLDAPQPCLGICIWRPVEWVKHSDYEKLRQRTISEFESERRLRQLARQIAWVTPRQGRWEQGWRLAHNQARELLEASAMIA